MDKKNPDELLKEAEDAYRLHNSGWLIYLWRIVRSRCEKCGARMIPHETDIGRTEICEVYKSRHRKYANGFNWTTFFAVSTFLLLVILAMEKCNNRTVATDKHDDRVPEAYIPYP